MLMYMSAWNSDLKGSCFCFLCILWNVLITLISNLKSEASMEVRLWWRWKGLGMLSKGPASRSRRLKTLRTFAPHKFLRLFLQLFNTTTNHHSKHTICVIDCYKMAHHHWARLQGHARCCNLQSQAWLGLAERWPVGQGFGGLQWKPRGKGWNHMDFSQLLSWSQLQPHPQPLSACSQPTKSPPHEGIVCCSGIPSTYLA